MTCLLVERQSCMDQLDLSAWSYVGFRQTIAELRVQRDAIVESPGGIAPPGAPKTVRDPLESHGSRCSAVAMA